MESGGRCSQSVQINQVHCGFSPGHSSMVYIVPDLQVVSQGGTAAKGQTTGAEWGGDLVMVPAIKLTGNQLVAGTMPTYPPHA